MYFDKTRKEEFENHVMLNNYLDARIIENKNNKYAWTELHPNGPATIWNWNSKNEIISFLGSKVHNTELAKLNELYKQYLLNNNMI